LQTPIVFQPFHPLLQRAELFDIHLGLKFPVNLVLDARQVISQRAETILSVGFKIFEFLV